MLLPDLASLDLETDRLTLPMTNYLPPTEAADSGGIETRQPL